MASILPGRNPTQWTSATPWPWGLRAAGPSAHEWDGQTLGDQGLPNVLTINFQDAAAPAEVAHIGSLGSWRTRTRNSGQARRSGGDQLLQSFGGLVAECCLTVALGMENLGRIEARQPHRSPVAHADGVAVGDREALRAELRC